MVFPLKNHLSETHDCPQFSMVFHYVCKYPHPSLYFIMSHRLISWRFKNSKFRLHTINLPRVFRTWGFNPLVIKFSKVDSCFQIIALLPYQRRISLFMLKFLFRLYSSSYCTSSWATQTIDSSNWIVDMSKSHARNVL